MWINKRLLKRISFFILLFGYANFGMATEYFFHPKIGNDNNSGLTSIAPFKSLKKASTLNLLPGDILYLAAENTFHGGLYLNEIRGTSENPILIKSYNWNYFPKKAKTKIDAKDESNGILLKNCSHIIIENIEIEANGGFISANEKMRCGVLVLVDQPGMEEGILLKNLKVSNIFFNKKGMQRGKSEVKTANGTQTYGWGIRFIVHSENAILKDVTISDCTVFNVAHTGIKLTAKKNHLLNVKIYNNQVSKTGGPGIQMSGVRFGHIAHNSVNYSGSKDDSRKWGRGSGLWTWSAADILIEKNRFTYANGPGDSAGCHIDFNCRNIIVQYNFSAHNAGGFCEILGNNYNCAYRYNISVDDGFREKGIDGAFQEGKTFWLSGYNGGKRNGPFNSYFYNNTIYLNESITSRVAIDRVADGVLIANNIFYIKGKSKAVKGDQYKPENEGKSKLKDVFFKNNLFLTAKSWPSEQKLQDEAPMFGNPKFFNEGGIKIEDYIPQNTLLIKNKGVKIPQLSNDSLGLIYGLHPPVDILGNPIIGLPDMGAIELR